jgi:L-iditol 2-dehydrogenase
MKAAYFYGPEDIRIEERPIPKCPKGGALLKLHGSLICGTDIKIFKNGHPMLIPPQIIGHESCGEIVEINDPNYGLKVGDRVTVQTTVACGKCEMCLQGKFNLCQNIKGICLHYPGTFAEYVAIPEEALRLGNLLKAPDNLKNEEVCLAEPLACVINGQDLLNIQPGEDVLIIGGGPIGILHAELASLSGAGRVVLAEKSAQRLEIAGRFGYSNYIDTGKNDLIAEVMKLTNNRGVDVAIATAPAKEPQEQAVETLAFRGRLSLFGSLPKGKSNITIDSRTIHYKEIQIMGASSSKTYHMKRALAILAAGRIKTQAIITHTMPLEKIVDAIKMALNGEALKIYLKND